MRSGLLLLLFFSAIALHARQRWYGVESGVLRSVVDAGGVQMKQTEYFTDWGNLTATISVIDSTGSFDSETITIAGPDDLVFYEKGRAEALRYKRVNPRINWLAPDAETVSKYSILHLGPERIDTLDCQKFSMIINNRGNYQQMIYWIYKGIPVQYDCTKMGVGVSQRFISLDENAVVDSSLFLLPDGVIVKDAR